MAIAMVHSGKTGSTNAASLVITSATAGNILVVWQSTITGGEKAPSMSDNISGTTGWFKHGVSPSFSIGKGRLWLWTKLAVGGETELKASIAEAATNSGIAYTEMSGMTKELDLAATTESTLGLQSTFETPAVSASAGSAVFAGAAYSGADGGAKAGFQLVPDAGASSRTGGWWYVSEAAISEKKWTLEWTTAREGCVATVAFKAAGSHAHTLTASQGQTVSRVTTPARTLAASQGQAASRLATVARILTRTQAQVVSRLATVGRIFKLIQAGSYLQVPTTPVTESLELLEVFPRDEEGGPELWTVLSWSETIGTVIELNKGLVGKPHPKGWVTNEAAKKAGARYNVASYTDPFNIMRVRNVETGALAGEEGYLAIGICVPSAAERSGYFLRIQRTAAPAWKVTLERWVNGVKTVLAETTLVSTFFSARGVPGTSAFVGFAITCVGGIVRVWNEEASGSWTQLLEAADKTFTSGFNTMEVWGSKGELSQMQAGSMDGQAFMAGEIKRGRLLTATQAQAAELRHLAISRALTVSQAQTPTLARAVTRSLTTTQPQVATRLATVGRTLTTTQAQAITRAPTSLARALTASQPQAISRQAGLSRTLTVAATQVVSRLASPTRALKITQGQTPTLARAPSRTLSITQAQAITRTTSTARSLSITQSQSPTRIAALARSLTATQGQTPTVTKATTRLFSITQGQTASRLTAVARTLVASAAQVVSRLTNPARTLRIAQAQEVVMTGPSEHTNTPITLTCSGTQTARLLRTPVARTLRTSATQSPTLSRAMTRALSVAVTQVVSRGTSLQRTLTCTGAQSTTVTATGSKSALLTTAASQSLSLRRQIARTLLAAGAQTATLVGHVEEQPTPPPARMTSTVKSATNLTATVEPALNMTSGVRTP